MVNTLCYKWLWCFERDYYKTDEIDDEGKFLQKTHKKHNNKFLIN